MALKSVLLNGQNRLALQCAASNVSLVNLRAKRAYMIMHESAVFELRTYTSYEGKLPEVLARFRDHVMKLFEKHGMINVAYWVPQDAPASQNTLIYVLAHSSREAAKMNWDAFRKDPEWQRVRNETEANGKLVLKIESVFMDSTEFSPMK